MRSEPNSDTGTRQTIALRFKTPVAHHLQVLAQVLFADAIVGAAETAFFEFAIENGFSERTTSLKYPSADRLTTSESVGAAFDDFLVFCDAFSERLESLSSRGHIATVAPGLVNAFIRDAACFPGPGRVRDSRRVSLVDQEFYSLTLLPQHVVKIEEVGVELFGRNRKRRAVVERAVLWFAQIHGLSDVDHAPRFERYPETSLLNLNRYFTREVLAVVAAMQPLAEGVGRFRMWSSVEKAFLLATDRLGDALFNAAKREKHTQR